MCVAVPGSSGEIRGETNRWLEMEPLVSPVLDQMLCSIALRAASPRERPLPGKLLNADFFVLRTRQGCHERYQIVDFILGQGKGLNVIIKPRVFQSVALVVVIYRIPQRLH